MGCLSFVEYRLLSGWKCIFRSHVGGFFGDFVVVDGVVLEEDFVEGVGK